MSAHVLATMPPQVQRWVEDLFLNSHLLGRWITDYVDLEESLAVGSIAQEDMAHAGALLEAYGCDEMTRDEFVFQRSASEWYPTRVLSTPKDSWPATVVRSYLLAAAARARIEEMRQSEDHVGLAGVLDSEQKLHQVHWRRWLQILAADSTTGPQLAAALEEAMALSGDVLSYDSAPDDKVRDRYAKWCATVQRDLAGLGVESPSPAECVTRTTATALPALASALELLTQLRRDPDDQVKGLYR